MREIGPTRAWLGLALGAALMLAPSVAQAAARVKVEVDRERLTLDDELVVQAEIEGDFDSVEEPDFEGFKLVERSPQHREAVQWINGRFSRKVMQLITYRLVPARAGTLTTGAIRVRHSGQVVAGSQPIRIQVSEPHRKRPLNAAQARSLANVGRDQTFFVHASTERDSYFVGEPFVLSWTLYFRDYALEKWDLVSAPRLEGLLVEELLAVDERPAFGRQRIGQKVYRTLLRSQQLATPLKPGTVLIDPMVARVTASNWGDRRRHTVRSWPWKLEILPLPEEDRPDIFHEGSIGQFSMNVELRGDNDDQEPTTARTGTRIVMLVTVKGRGNLVGVKWPTLEGGDESLEVKPHPTTVDAIERDETGVHGERTFRYLMTPLEPGQVRLPAVRFAYFDPIAKRYVTRSWPGKTLAVEGDAVSPSSGRAAYEHRDIGSLFPEAELSQRSAGPFAGSPLFWLLVLVPLGVFAVVEGRHRYLAHLGRDPIGRRSKLADANARKRLAAAEQAIKDGLAKDCYGQLSHTLTSYLEERANLPVGGMTHDELREAAIQAGYSEEQLDRLITELENFDFARFAPGAKADRQMRDACTRVAALLDELGTVEPRRRP